MTEKFEKTYKSAYTLEALYLSTFEIIKKWTMPIRNWGKARGELSIMYPGRLSD